MRVSMMKCALAGCATFLVAGCATQQSIAPAYRISAPAAQIVDGTSMLQRGRAQLDAGLDALAIESFRAAIRFNLRDVDAYNGLAVAYGRIGRNDLAQRYFEIALAKDPTNFKVQSNLAKLPGNEGLAIQQNASVPVMPLDLVAVTTEVDDQASDAATIGEALHALAKAHITPIPNSSVTTAEILGKRGVLSARFAVAAAGATIVSARSAVMTSATPPQPIRLPTLPSERPAPYVQSELRVAVRLERVSLNEVRLITLETAPAAPPRSAHSFDSFGDRIALWLPEYMTAEQAVSRYQGDESLVIMAAVERAGARKNGNILAENEPEDRPNFAYIRFDANNDVVGT